MKLAGIFLVSMVAGLFCCTIVGIPIGIFILLLLINCLRKGAA